MGCKEPALRDRVKRRWIPRTVVALSQVSWPARTAAALRRARGRRGRVELYVAFDDPCSAVALLDLDERLAGRPVDLVIGAVVRRGLPGDPAVDDKRRHAVTDARRLGLRRGLTLARRQPLTAQDTAFLAAWVAAVPQSVALQRFCVAAVARLWFTAGEDPVEEADYERLWTSIMGAPPVAAPDGLIRAVETRMAARGPYDTPAAVVHGQWFFAQDRGAQIADRLDDLGWTAS